MLETRSKQLVFILASLSLSLLCFVFIGTPVAQADPGDIRVTVTREGDDAPMESVLVEVKCTDGVYTPFNGSPLTDGSGVIQAQPPLAANCDVDDETLNVKVSKAGYETTNNEGGIIQGWSSLSDPNEVTMGAVKFGLAVLVETEIGQPVDSFDRIRFRDLDYTLQDPVNSNKFYWEDTTAVSAVLSIEKDGYVDTQTTNSGGTSAIRPSEFNGQTLVILTGGVGACTNTIGDEEISCLGLQYAYKYTSITNELGGALSSVSLNAGASNVACSESSGSWYCPISTMDIAPTGFSASKDGYVSKTVVGGVGIESRVVYTDPQIDLGALNALMQFAHKVVIKDELNSALTPTSVTAGASSTACTISGSSAYCPVLVTEDNTLTNGFVITLDGYVTSVAADVPLAANRATLAAPQAVTTMTGANGLDFSHKLNIANELGQVPSLDNDSYVRYGGWAESECVRSSSSFYCPILLANDNVQDISTAYYVFILGYTYPDPDLDINASRLVFFGGGSQNRTAHTDSQKVVTMTADNGVEFNHKIVVKDELGNALTPDSVTGGIADKVCQISGNTGYCNLSYVEEGNFVSNGFTVVKDGYVTAEVNFGFINGNDQTAPPDIITMTSSNGLDFGVKTLVTNGSSHLSGATVTAGDSGSVTCSESGTAYYCAVPLAHTSTTVNASLTGYTSASGSYTDRTIGTNPQQQLLIVLSVPSSGGSTPIWLIPQQIVPPVITPPSLPNDPQSPHSPPEQQKSEAELIFEQSNPIAYFTQNGSESTMRHGSGERSAIVNSFKEAFGREPSSLKDWEDILLISNGRWPLGISKPAEARAFINFRIIYGRSANMRNSTDVNALKMMAYGVRSLANRDLAGERRAIARFRSTFGFYPTISRHWNIIRVLVYSGLIK